MPCKDWSNLQAQKQSVVGGAGNTRAGDCKHDRTGNNTQEGGAWAKKQD